jgi:hypothetical protein
MAIIGDGTRRSGRSLVVLVPHRACPGFLQFNFLVRLSRQTSDTKLVEDVYDGVHNGPILGTGVAGIVRKCKHRQTGIDFAVKCLNIGLIESDAVIETLREEIFIMCQADHPDIIRLEEVYESDSQIYLILKLLTGGDMFDRLEEQPEYHYSEVQCAKIVKQMTSAVRYLHSNKVIHRDLKLGSCIRSCVRVPRTRCVYGMISVFRLCYHKRLLVVYHMFLHAYTRTHS